MSDELNVLVNVPKVIIIGDETIKITPVKVGKLPKLFEFMSKVGGTWLPKLVGGEFTGTDRNKLFPVLLEALNQSSETILDFVAWAVNKDREWVDNLEVDQLIEILTTLFEVNADFFTQKVLPKIGSMSTSQTKTE